ncbi:NADPH:quinone oxidoreductase family protein [Nocardia sp. NBC_00565]|uniref:NADPH:quinone oxidoreductase family protein n=1 Tax=Nocardia sp. NBC_00565 TaxID=2975993 RepID=UPI002E7FCB68|nr:NADPH:quinone oxidoreductase family protein [Nocardia sp. NBC_00565]WUC07928.1 NADPH:quinone oxidoreductase family protein [Nocardia sp. NBC_00565]
MSAARIHRLGTPDAIEIDTVDVPTPGPGEILVEVHAAAVNFPDTLMIAGNYQTRTPLPYIPGHEAAGIVSGIGDGVDGLVMGDRVAVLAPGAFAEYLVAPAEVATAIPDGLDFAAAAATWVCHLTAYHALRSVARISSGNTVLVLGAGGGVGLAAVEIAAAMGAKVVAAASSPAKLEAARSKGARVTIDYSSGDLRDKLRGTVGPGALDAVIDPVGGRHSEPALREIRWGGTFVTLGYASGEIPRIPVNLILLKGAVIKGLEIRTFAQHDPDSASRDRAEFADLWRTGRIRPTIHARYPLRDTREALEEVAQRRSIGKTIIDVRPGHR